MKNIGREVLFLPTGEGNPRNGEGTFARLHDGRIMAAYTHYYGDDWHDHAIARICAVYSSDEGETRLASPGMTVCSLTCRRIISMK